MPTYDPTVAIIAGQIYAAWAEQDAASDPNWRVHTEWREWAVQHARAIVAETIRTEPTCTHRYLNTSWCVDCGAEKTDPREGDPT